MGKPEGYVERQVNGWIGRYEKAKTDDWPAMDEVAKWLVENRPAESGAALIHNDYKFDNVVLDANDLTKIIAVLDWEMCTLGDPLMDLGCTLAYWIQADDHEALKYFVPGPTFLPGNLTRRELLERYAADVRPRRRAGPLLLLLRPLQVGRHYPANLRAVRARVYAGPAVCRHESASRQPEPFGRPGNCNRRCFLTQFTAGP